MQFRSVSLSGYGLRLCRCYFMSHSALKDVMPSLIFTFVYFICLIFVSISTDRQHMRALGYGHHNTSSLRGHALCRTLLCGLGPYQFI